MTVTSRWAFGGLLLVGFVGVAALFFPGHINGDAGYIYRCATGAYPCEDWHSPTISIIWGWCTVLWDSSASLMLLILALVFSGLGLIAFKTRTFFARFYWLSIIVLPPVFFQLGVLTKDTLAASITVFAVSLLLYDATQKMAQRILLVFAILLFLLAALVKISAVFSMVPLVASTVVRIFSSKPLLRSYTLVFVSALSFGLAFYGGFDLVKQHTDAKKTWISNAIYLFDLVGMSTISGENFLEGFVSEDQSFIADNCYEPLTWDGLAWGHCRYVTQHMFVNKLWQGNGLRDRWYKVVSANPSSYFEHRVKHFKAFMMTVGKDVFYYRYEDVHLPKPNQNVLMNHLNTFSKDMGFYSHLFRPISWLILSVMLMVMSFWKALRLTNNTGENSNLLVMNLVLCLTASNVIFYATLFFFGVAYDFRYSNAVIWQTVLAFGFFILPLSLNREPLDGRNYE